MKLVLIGRSDEQNNYNLISSRFGLKPSELFEMVRFGVSKYGARRGAPLRPTVAAGDDLRRAIGSSLRGVMLVLGLVFGGLFAGVVVWQVSDCMKTLDLQKFGAPTEAVVSRLYRADCGKGGCSINVEYVFEPPGAPERLIHGFARITGDHQRDDPDLAYAQLHMSVPIVYDTRKPEVSSLNFRNWIYKQNPIKMMFSIIGAIGFAELIPIAVVVACLLPLIIKAKRS